MGRLKVSKHGLNRSNRRYNRIPWNRQTEITSSSTAKGINKQINCVRYGIIHEIGAKPQRAD